MESDAEAGNEDNGEAGDLDEELAMIKECVGNFTLNGFIEFALWGHVPPPGGEEKRATCFWSKNMTEKGEKSKMGRKFSRKEMADKESCARVLSSVLGGRDLSSRDFVIQQHNDQSKKSLEQAETFNHMSAILESEYLRNKNKFHGDLQALQMEHKTLPWHLQALEN